MKDLTKPILICLYIIIFMLGMILGTILPTIYENKHPPLRQTEQWGGVVPMDIYTIYDRDTGVYYAITEKGGICVMQTMSGETKLVDEGEPPIIHKNQGE